jgi:hypothetical protein
MHTPIAGDLENRNNLRYAPYAKMQCAVMMVVTVIGYRIRMEPFLSLSSASFGERKGTGTDRYRES